MLENIQITFTKQLQIILRKYIRSIKIRNLYYEIKTNKEYSYLLILFLKFHYTSQVDSLIDIIVIDRPHKKKRFAVIYSLLSINYNTRFFIKTDINETANLLSINAIYSAANWYEREVWDMFGIYFLNHPDLRRILTDYNFQGYPLRKDFPLSGFIELFYSSKNSRLLYKKPKLNQAYRLFIYQDSSVLLSNNSNKNQLN